MHLEAWNFNHPGWQNFELEANTVTPFQQPLNVRAVSWTPGTNGAVTAPVVVIEPPQAPPPAGFGRGGAGFWRSHGEGPTPEQLAAIQNPGTAAPPMPAAKPSESKPVTQADLDAYLATIKDKVHGAIVFVGPHVEVAENFVPTPLRRSDESWAQPAGRRGGFPQRGPATAPEGLTAAEITGQVNKFLIAIGALVKVTDSGRPYGIVLQQSTAGYNENPNSPNLPTLVMGNEDYGRIYRTTTIDHMPVTLRINIKNQFYPDGRTVYNVVGELSGTDKADEVVMAGGHFDSWNPATGATDNAAGGSVAVEALRLIQTLKLPHRRNDPRGAVEWRGGRSLRFTGLCGATLWQRGETQARVVQAGRIPEPRRRYWQATWRKRFRTAGGCPCNWRGDRDGQLQATGASIQVNFPTVGRQTGGTDSTSFNNAGLPGVGYSQDPFDYNTYTHHTSFDTYDADL